MVDASCIQIKPGTRGNLEVNYVTLHHTSTILPTRESLGCLGGAPVGRRTSDLAVMGSIPGLGVIRHLGQLSLPSLRGRYIEYQLSLAGVKVGCVRLCRVAGNTV